MPVAYLEPPAQWEREIREGVQYFTTIINILNPLSNMGIENRRGVQHAVLQS